MLMLMPHLVGPVFLFFGVFKNHTRKVGTEYVFFYELKDLAVFSIGLAIWL